MNFPGRLLWREYPTDHRRGRFGLPVRFWDVSTILKDPALADKPEDEASVNLITILPNWAPSLERRKSKLGDHDNRQKPGEPPKEKMILLSQ